MKKTRKAMLSAAVAIAMCTSVMAGTTYALFTSESEVNIAVTSANVSVVATPSKITMYEATADENGVMTDNNGAKYSYSNGKDVAIAYDKDGNLLLQNVKPGDKYEIEVTATNESTIDVLYRTRLALADGADTKLMSAMTVLVGEESDVNKPEVNVMSYASAWENWSVSVKSTPKTEKITLALPMTAGNDYKNLSTALAVTVEAVQGNAKASDGREIKNIPTATVSSISEFKTAISNSSKQAPAYIELQDDLTVTSASGIKNVGVINVDADNYAVIDLNGHTVECEASADSIFLFTVQKGGYAVLQNGSLDYKNVSGKIGSKGYPIRNKGELVLRNMNVVNTDNSSALLSSIGDSTADALLTIESGYYYSNVQLTLKIEEFTKSVIYGGTFMNRGIYATAHLWDDADIYGGEFIHYGVYGNEDISTGVPLMVQAVDFRSYTCEPVVNIYDGKFEWRNANGGEGGWATLSFGNGYTGYGKSELGLTINIYGGTYINGKFGRSGKDAETPVVGTDKVNIYDKDFNESLIDGSVAPYVTYYNK